MSSIRALLIAGCLLVPGLHDQPRRHSGPSTTCVCEAARREGGWCGVCNVGHLASLKIPSAAVFDFLDAHGHQVDAKTLKCPTCRSAHRGHGYCEHCGIGWADGLAYMSRLTYGIARGRRVDPQRLECQPCRSRARSSGTEDSGEPYGWCDACERGWVGNVAIADRGEYEHMREAVKRLLRALEALKRCESCAVAMLADIKCRQCGISYKDGQPVEPVSATPAAENGSSPER